MKSLIKDACICLIIFAIIIFGFIYIDPTANMGSLKNIDLSYFEDKSGQLKLDDIEKVFLENKFIKKESSKVFFGKSYSAFWIRILVKDVSDLEDYLAIYSPNVQDVKLHISKEGQTKVHYLGWENNKEREDMGLIYPVFSLKDYEKEDLVNEPIYIRIQSDYLHDYSIFFYTQDELNHMRNMDFCIVFMLFGVLATIFITNLLIFFKLRNKNCLVFAISVLFLAIHQGSLTGIYNIIPNQYSSLLMGLAIEMMSLFLASIIGMFIVFSNVKSLNKKYYHRLIFLIGFVLLGLVIGQINEITANKFAHMAAGLTVASVLYCAVKLHLSKAVNLRYLLLGWYVLLFLFIVVMLRGQGILINNFVVINTYFFSIVVIYMLFSVGVSEHTHNLYLKSIEMNKRYEMALEQARSAEIALLQTQIKPHFLYNTLASIERLCDVDSQKAKTAIADFADYLRGNIDFSTETKLVPIEREIENIKCYLSLEKMRFEERLQVKYDIKAKGFMIPPLLVQPIVENSVRHGITKKREGGTVFIIVDETEIEYVITVEDDGVGFIPNVKSDSKHKSIGMSNAKSRLSKQCGGEFNIISEIGKGTKVTITIPKG